MTRKQHTALLLVLGSLTAIGPFSIDMYLPGFPAIARDLQTDMASVALTLTSYFIGISTGQLVYGPLLDRYGRKPPLIVGLIIYVAAAVGCALAPTIEMLIGLRFLLALGACVGIVAARAIVRDLFQVEEIARIFSTLMLVLGISPIIAPSVGAVMTETYGWRWIFVVLAGIGTVILYGVIRWLQETRKEDTTFALHPAYIVRSYLQVITQPTFVVYALASAAASCGLFAYIADAPFVFMKLYGLSEREFGLTFGLSACGVIGASQLNRLVLRRYGSRIISLYAVSGQCMFAGALVFAAQSLAPLAVVTTLIVGYLVCLGFLSPNTTALAIEPFSRGAGTASALLGSMQMAAGALGSAVVSWLHTGSAVPMASVLTAAAVGSLLLQMAHAARRETSTS
ncbi:MAG TPA: multidrug effflux MFS transporter [Bacteroidota bacterium]|nr:multidrug effflux MFS transporter [Bacteroidota bacterium]